jgi:serine/threonine-protein kinase
MLTDIKGFTAMTSRQTREQNARMLSEHDRLLLPITRSFGGKLVHKRGDALLLTFKSPTEAVLCGMTMQDALYRHNLLQTEEERIPVRIVLHTGEVIVEKEQVVGEPMQIVLAVEGVADEGEVVFTEAVRLSMNRAEIQAEERGAIGLPGRDEQLRLYRCTPAAEGPPFGGRDARVREGGPIDAQALMAVAEKKLGGVVRHGGERIARARVLGLKLLGTIRASTRQQRLAAAGLLVLVIAVGGALALRRSGPAQQARRSLEAGQPQSALRLLEPLCKPACKPEVRALQAAALHDLKRHREEHASLAILSPAELADEPLAVTRLAEDFARNERDAQVRGLLSGASSGSARLLERLASGSSSLAQFGALRFLDEAGLAEDLDVTELYVRALGEDDCRMRASAARRLGERGDAEAKPELLRLSGIPKKGLLQTENCGQDEARDALRRLDK